MEDPNRLDRWFQASLALLVVVVSTIGITIAASRASSTDAVFNVLVPVFSTWVGTVLAFYFSKANFEAASASARSTNESLLNTVRQLSPDQGGSETLVKNAMTPKDKIKARTLTATETDKSVTVKDIKDIIDKGGTRVPIFEASGAVRYIFYDSVITGYLVEAAARTPAVTAPLSTTIEDLLKERSGAKTIKDIVTLFAFVPEAANLADAQKALTSKDGIRDVFVTKTGKGDEAVIGWLTNTDIAKGNDGANHAVASSAATSSLVSFNWVALAISFNCSTLVGAGDRGR